MKCISGKLFGIVIGDVFSREPLVLLCCLHFLCKSFCFQGKLSKMGICRILLLTECGNRTVADEEDFFSQWSDGESLILFLDKLFHMFMWINLLSKYTTSYTTVNIFFLSCICDIKDIYTRDGGIIIKRSIIWYLQSYPVHLYQELPCLENSCCDAKLIPVFWNSDICQVEQ